MPSKLFTAVRNPIVTCKGAPNPIYGQWQVVFKVKIDGEVFDYCRELPPHFRERHMTEAEVMVWAKKQCRQKSLHGAVIDWF